MRKASSRVDSPRGKETDGSKWDENRIYLLEKIIKVIEKSSVDWKGNVEGNRSIRIQQADYNACGKERIILEAKELEKQGLIRIKWLIYGSDIEKIMYSLKDIDTFYRILDKQKKSLRFQWAYEFLNQFLCDISKEWIINYMKALKSSLDKGRFPMELALFDEMQENHDKVMDEANGLLLFRCLKCLDHLSEPIYKKIFSKYSLGGSKVFENDLEQRIISIAKKYHPDVVDDMSDTEVLSQILIEEYAQELSVKGNLLLLLDGKEVDLSLFPYGVVLNSDTLKYATICEHQKLSKVITVENKANYMSMPYEDNTLIIYTHGYFSPKERYFLRGLAKVLKKYQVSFWHTGDLDYGGIQIFRFIRSQIFEELQPYLMNVDQYNRYMKYGEAIVDTSLEKLKRLNDPMLQPLIDRIITEGIVIEQECFLIDMNIMDRVEDIV